jgi:heptosyltransferase I
LATEPTLSHGASGSGGDRPRRVLIVRIGAMGDVLHAMPAVAALRELHPDWVINWAIEPAWMELLQAQGEGSDTSNQFSGRDARQPLVDTPVPVRTREWKRQPLSLSTARDFAGLRQRLREDRYDICVDMQGSIRSAIVGRMAEAAIFAGSSKPRETPAAMFYKQKVELTATHVIEQGCELLGVAVGETLRPAKVTLPIDPAAERWCDALLAGEAPKFALIAPTAGWGAKQWPAERYGEVAAALAQAGFRVLVNASSPNDEAGLRVVEASGGAVTLVPCSIGQMIALVRRAGIVIAGDTGPLHLAAALERPVVGLFGPTDPARNGPYGTNARVLRHVSSQLDHSRLRETEKGLMQITVDEVIDAALGLLRTGQDKVKV